MDESTRVGLNYFITVALVLAAFALLSTLLFPSSVHGSIPYMVALVGVALGVGHRLVYGGVLRELELEPLPPADGYPEGDEDESNLTPAERYERRQQSDDEA